MSELPKGWVGISISDVADVKGGKRLPKGGGFSEVETSYPYIRVSDFDNGTVNTQKLKFIDRETHLAISNYVISSDDLYISIAGTIGLVGDIPKTLDGANLTENAAKLCNLHILNKDFLKYFLQSPRALQQFIDKTTSSGQPKLALFRIKDCSLGLAPLAEQKRIVEKLDEVLAQVDTIKSRLDGIPDLLKRFRQSVLASAVSGKLTEEWRENLELNWENVTLSEIISPERPISYGVLKPGDYVKDGIVLLRIKDILGDLVSLDSPHRISNELSEQYKRTLLKGDEILISLVGTLGRIALVPKSLEGANVHRNLGVVVPKQGVVSKFVFYLMKSPSIQEQIEKSRTGANQPLLNLGDIKKFAVQLPEPSEQKEIVRLVDQYFAFADTIEAQVKKAQARVDNLTQSILAKAFRGELVEQDPNDEPADKLLERIAEARKEAEALAKAAKKAEAAKKRAAKSA